MFDLMVLEKAIRQGKIERVEDIFRNTNDLDEVSGSLMLLEASKYFDFKVVEVDEKVLTTRAELSRVMGYAHESGLRYILDKYRVKKYPISGFAGNLAEPIRNTFGLKETDFSTVLVDWKAFLVAGTYGTTDEAMAVHEYIMKMEKYGRMEKVAQTVTGKTLAELQGKPINRPAPETEPLCKILHFNGHLIHIINFSPYDEVVMVKEVSDALGRGKRALKELSKTHPEVKTSIIILRGKEYSRFFDICKTLGIMGGSNSIGICPIERLGTLLIYGNVDKLAMELHRLVNGYLLGTRPAMALMPYIRPVQGQLQLSN